MSHNYVQNERQLDKVLQKFAQETLKPDESSLRNAANIQQQIVLALHQSVYKVDRVILSGSFGKATNIKPFDIDMVAFLNDAKPPFNNVLQDWEKHLQISKLFDKVEVTNYLIKLQSGNYSVDLLPATNFRGALGYGYSHVSPMMVQYINALNQVKKEANPGNSNYSSSLAEYQVNYIKTQSPFVHQLIRLCKFWKNQINLESKTTKINGFSLAVEVVAVLVGRNEETSHDTSIVKAFRNFLNCLANFETINANVEMPNEVRMMLNPVSIPVFPKPVILDPANPWNNLAMNFNQNQKDWIKYYAKKTLEQLEDLIRNIPAGCNENYVKQKLFNFA